MSHQEIRDILTQRQSSYAWEAYLKHRKQERIKQPSTGEKPKPTKNPNPYLRIGLTPLGGSINGRS